MKITLRTPDDWHIHLRDDDALHTTIPDVAKQFQRAIVMPNLKPPITHAQQAIEYRQRILDALPLELKTSFDPLMTLYLTDSTTKDMVYDAAKSNVVKAFKLYPAGATTNSDAGVTSLDRCSDALDAMAEMGMPLLVHGEVTDPDIDIFDREAVFIENVLRPLIIQKPNLKIVLEHITTKNAVDFIRTQDQNIAATITAHHLIYSRNDMLVGGIKPHLFCLPILKRESHRLALLQAATSGDPRFFLGTDSAPHSKSAKENACGCAGCYTASHAMELYAMAFESVNALDKLEAFASVFGAQFYQLPLNEGLITLQKTPQLIPAARPYLDGELIPLFAGQSIPWTCTRQY